MSVSGLKYKIQRKNRLLKKIKNTEIFYLLLLILVIISLYSSSWHYPIYGGWDDATYVLNNNHLSFSFSNIMHWFKHSCVGCYLPMTMISYMFDYSLWEFNSFGYHLQNIFWHIVAVITIYRCFRLFNIKSWIAFFICLIFAVHPQRVESVVWLSERKDVLCAAFYFLSIYIYVRNDGEKFSITAFMFFILSILSKPMAISLPVILLLYEFYKNNKDKRLETVVSCSLPVFSERKIDLSDIALKEKEAKDQRPITCTSWSVSGDLEIENRKNTQHNNKTYSTMQKTGALLRLFYGYKYYLLKLWPYFLIFLISIPASIIIQGEAINSHNQILSLQRLYTIFYNAYWYFSQTILSTELNPIYPLISSSNSAVEISLFYIGLLVAAIIIFYKNKKIFIYSILPLVLAYIISLLPVIGLVRLGSTDHADRYSYIPSVFIWFSIGLILSRVIYSNKQKENGLVSSPLINPKFIFLILSIYSAALLISNYQYQKIWKNEHILYSYASDIYPTNTLSLYYLANVELNKKNYSEVLRLAEEINLKTENSLIAYFLKASVLYHLNKEKAIKLLLHIKPFCKSRHIYKNYYLKTLKMLIECYSSIGSKQKSIEYINELLLVQSLDEFDRVYYLGVKAYYKEDYRTALYQLKKAQKFQPNNKNIRNNVNACLKQQKEKLLYLKR